MSSADAQQDDGATAAPSSVADSSGAPSDFFHMALHELRTIELDHVRKGANRALSVGTSGRWYFDWFEDHVGPLVEHVGVEAFEPRPPDLPGYARWVESTADHFLDVDDGSMDLVFAGQTTEHLWAEELLGFLLESHRVLAIGGQLVMDSPNRRVTEHLRWSHGGHTIELSADEMAELARLAGFDVTARGLWRCRFEDRILTLEDGMDDPGLVVRRIATGRDRPDDCFVWWIDADRADREPDVDALKAAIDHLFATHWDTRISRGMWPGPDSDGVDLPTGGPVTVSNLPIYLHAGRWQLTVHAAAGTLDDLDGLRLEVSAPGGAVLHRVDTPLERDGDHVTWGFDQQELAFALTLEIQAQAVGRPVRLRMPVELAAVDSA